MEALKLVNELRVAAGCAPLDDLPKGLKHVNNACPIALALRDIGLDILVGCGAVYFWNEGLTALAVKVWKVPPNMMPGIVQLPNVLEEWVAEFDAGSHPEYIL